MPKAFTEHKVESLSQKIENIKQRGFGMENILTLFIYCVYLGAI